MAKIEIYTTPTCPFCIHAKQLLDSKQLTYQEIDVSRTPELRQEMMTRAQKHTVPQIFIDMKSIGGCDELFALNNSGELDKIISKSNTTT